jgi:putative membrane protein
VGFLGGERSAIIRAHDPPGDPANDEGEPVIDLLVKIVINAIAVYVAVLLVPQINFPAAQDLLSLQGNWWHVVVVALILALINAYVKPILRILSLPITLMSMGLFLFVLNAIMLEITDGIVPGFEIDGFGWAIVGAVVLALVSLVTNRIGAVAQRQPRE